MSELLGDVSDPVIKKQISEIISNWKQIAKKSKPKTNSPTETQQTDAEKSTEVENKSPEKASDIALKVPEVPQTTMAKDSDDEEDAKDLRPEI